MAGGLLTNGQREFAGTFAHETGLNPRVVASWMLAEESGSAAQGREASHNHNWLNIAMTDSGAAPGAYNGAWKNPRTAGTAAAEWMRGRGPIAHQYGAPAEGIRNILNSHGGNYEAQINAIAHSGWASSGYNGGSTLRQLYGELGGEKIPPGLSQSPGKMVPGQPGTTTEIPGFPATQGTRATTQLNFDTAGYQKARNEAEINKTILGLFKGSERGGLRSVFPGTMPQIGQFLKSKTIPGTPGSRGLASKTVSEPGKAERLGGPGTSGRVPAGHELHGLLPAGAKVLEWNRKDQGRDLQLTPGQVLLATGNGYVIRNGTDPSGFGPDYPIIHLTTGPEAGKDVYYGHTDSLVKPGQKLVAGQPVAKTSRTGHNAKPGWLEYGYAPGGTPGPFGQETPF